MNKLFKNQAGYTLVELLVVISVVVITVGVSADLIVSIIRSYNKTKVYNEIEQNGNYALAKIIYDLRRAKSVNIVRSYGDIAPVPNGGSIYITDIDNNEIRYSIEGFTEDGVSAGGNPGNILRELTFADGAVKKGIMMNNDPLEGVHVTCGGYNCFSYVDLDKKAVRVSFRVSQGFDPINATSKSYQGTNEFETVVVLRYKN